MSGSLQDNCQWLSVTEETLFLHDGLIRVTDLVELPRDVNSSHEADNEVISFDLKNPKELSNRLLAVCGTQNNAYTKLLEYRLNALRGYWNAQRQVVLDEQNEREANNSEETLAILKKQGLYKEPEQASFSTRISVLLVIPLLQSQSRIDSSLCGVTSELLLNCLRDCAPLSLSKEPGDCLRGLENLLCSWLGENTSDENVKVEEDQHQRENIASALVALACARGHLKTLIHVVHLLQNLPNLESLHTSDVLGKLLETEGGPGQPTAVLGSKHILCWGFEDLLSTPDKENVAVPASEKDKEKQVESEIGRSLACDGVFLYTTNSQGKNLAKIGSGLHGTLRGYVYSRNLELGPGKVAYGNKLLIYRPSAFDNEAESNFCQIIDPSSLKPIKTLLTPHGFKNEGSQTTIGFCSDGRFFFWIWVPILPGDKSAKGIPVYLEMFDIDEEKGAIIPTQPQITLIKKDDTGAKSLNESFLSKLRPFRGSTSAATLVALTGGDPLSTKKEEPASGAVGSTSCSVSLKNLIRSPMFCDGSTLVILTSPAGTSTSTSATRSLFGGTLSGLRLLASNMCFNVETGQFNTRSDLSDAPTCALGRGAPLQGLGVCFDVRNNMIWMCSNDWVDQFFNPGHQSPHHIHRRLKVTDEVILPPEDMVPTSIAVRCILQHVGSMCLHQINNDLLHSPLGNCIVQQHSVDVAQLRRIYDILQKAMSIKDDQTIICTLVVMQLLLKISLFKLERPAEIQILKETRELLWKLLTSCNTEFKDTQILEEACQVIMVGLPVLYPSNTDKSQLLQTLLFDGRNNEALQMLRDLILVDFADKLRAQAVEKEESRYLRLTDSLVNHILQITIQESSKLLSDAANLNKNNFEEMLSSLPIASPCLRYMMALQSHLLREAVLFKQEENSSPERNKYLQEILMSVVQLASRVFSGSCEVLEVLLATCNNVIHNFKEEREGHLQGLERIAKSTILGHLLPVLLTAMNHVNLHCLPLADELMPKLVNLVVLSSQAALLLKSQVEAVMQDDLDSDTDTHVMELMAPTVDIDDMSSDDTEEQGFLAGLKIPAPWSSGKTVESIHPVRDNYRFKETVHIPGARCLYLRFDPRSSSQYDYDKLVIFAGPTTNSKRVLEYGGNTYGFGSRSVLGSGWPKDLVKVDGDTVTFSFEMRSGREHNTPDKAMWGFLVTVRAQESTEEVSSGLPFLADLALGLSVLGCTMLQLLYKGPEKSPQEVNCQHLLKSKLLQRCVWQSGTDPSALLDSPSSPEDNDDSLLARIRLSMEILQNLRKLCRRQVPQLRPSIRDVINPDDLEERVVSTVLKHLSLQETVFKLAKAENQQTEEFILLRAVIQEVYSKIDSLLRQLQTLAELEQRWHNEVLDQKEGNTTIPPFFSDFHLQETKGKELAMLCFVKEVTMDSDSERAVKNLREKFDDDVSNETFSSSKSLMPRTQHIMKGLRARLDLLLQVTIAPGEGIHVARSVSNNQESVMGVMVRSDTDVLSQITRSISVPTGVESFQDDSILDITIKQRKRKTHRRTPSSVLQDLVEGEGRDKPPHIILIEQLFSFIGSNPEKAISPNDFLAAAAIRLKRGNTRKQALIHMKELLTAATKVGGATHLVAAVTSVLQSGPCVEELTCGGMVPQVREAFAETMTAVVQLANKYPIACSNSIGLLCTIPYTRAEEKCLVRSGLVHLLDKLCSLANLRSDTSDTQSVNQKVSTMAWAGFQVLANRCVMWETEDGSQIEELEHSGLARQVSVLLTNHLARATECIGNEAAGTEALQDVLSLLNTLARSRMGRAILSQPACVSKLLSLLLDQRPSPKLVLIILQLCRVALPLMNTADCEQVELPVWGQHLTNTHWNTSEPITDPPAKIVSLLLAKLGDFLVPGDYATLVSRRPSVDLSQGTKSADKEKSEESDIQAGKLSVFIHKREDQLSHEVIQPLLGSDNRPFRIGGGANMERVVRMDREMTKLGKAEVTTEDAITALKKAAKWAQMGLVVSTGPPVESGQADTPTGDKKNVRKQPVDVVCREKNTELARTDPIRPFISGHVANNMAAEVIALLHGLLSAPETHSAQSWSEAVQRVLHNSLSCLPLLLASLDTLSSPRCNNRQLMSMSKMANAALCALGGFTEMIKPGCEVKMLGPGIDDSQGTVLSVSEQTGMVTIQLDPEGGEDRHPRYSDTIQVPITRVMPVRNEIYKSTNVPVTDSLVMAIKAILLPQDDGTCPLQQNLPLNGDGNSLSNQMSRVVAELQTRACMVLAQYLQDIEFTKEFIQHCGCTIDILKSLAKDCNSGDRQAVVETHCDRLRLLYRDCAKPPPPPSKLDSRANQEMMLDANRSFPPVRASVFSQAMTGVTFLGDPSTGSGLPRGTMIYANQPIPQQAPAFYWELEICSFGDSQEESGAVISFGFAPSADKKDGAWTNPVGTCLFLNNGKAVHYNGASLLQWRSVRLDVALNAGDVAGIGWERTGESPVQGQTPRGRVYFTYNGRRLNAYMDDVSGGMFPVVHIQKKNTRIRANFGTRPFAFAEGQQHKEAADAANDLTREIRESFGHLPFHPHSDSENEGSPQPSPDSSSPEEIQAPKGPPCKTATIPKPQSAYSPDDCLNFKLFSCYDNFVTTGPDPRGPVLQDDESDEEVQEEDNGSEDHYALLVKAWEQKVFPVIRRRFRNEAQRKDGLEQIRGALQLGMTDIARQTVEFLYEENGGIPRDLHLPTIENIKEDLAKFTIEKVRKGTTVVIRNTAETSTAGATVLPKFAVRSMLKTFGLTGNVLDVDNSNEIVQVEVYLRSEGVLVRFWYPIEMLERPPQGLRKSSITGGQILDTSNIFIHRELLCCESVLAKMYCRTALLKLIDHCNSPAMEIVSCSASSLGSGMAASAALLQLLDIENLQLLSNELLCPPQSHGTVMATSLTTASSLDKCLANQMCSLTKRLYRDEDKLKRELAVAIARAANQGEDYLIELTTQICLCFQTAPEMFPYEEFPVTEVKVNTDLHFPGAGCLVVSCKTDPKAAKKDTSLYKSPWARVFSYTGHRIKKTGSAVKLEVVCYPRDTTSTSNQNEQYTPAIIPTDRVHIRLGVSPPPGIILTIHALPPQFLLAVAYIETLITEKYGCGTRSCGSRESCKMSDSQLAFQSKDIHDSLWSVDNIVISPPVFRHMIELLCRHLWMTNTPAIIKEYLFHLLAQSLRILHYSEGCNSSKLPTLNPHLNPSTGLLVQLQAELRRLYEEETKDWPSGTLVSGSGIGIGVSNKGRFSTYFHALMEVNLAVAELRYEDYFKPPPSLTAPSSSNTTLETASSSSLQTLSSPTSSAKRKKLKAKRDKERGGAVPKRTTTQRTSESDSSVSVSSVSSTELVPTPPSSSTTAAAAASSSSSGASMATAASEPGKGDPSGTNLKMEDILWLHRAVTVSKILRCLGFKEKHGRRFLNDAISDAAKLLTTPSVASRMLVITGIPPNLSPDTVKQAIRASCNANGGLERDEIFLPELDVPSEVQQVPSEQSDQESAEASTEQVENKPEETPTKHIKGYAVINVLSKAKLENVKKTLFKNKVLVSSLTQDQEEAGDVPEEMLSVTSVLPTLVGEPHANTAIEEYLQYKFFSDEQQKEMVDPATLALTEIFHSCFIMEHKQGGSEVRHESGFICLGKDQILQNVQENLLCVFFNNIRPPKKSLAEQTMHILRRYGMLKSPDKELSPSADKPGKGKPFKKSPRSSKEKVVLGVVEKVNQRDKKPKGKDFSEKSSKEGATSDPVSTKGAKQSWMPEEAKYLTLDGFLQYVMDSAKQDIRTVWRAILACGFDIHFERCACLDMSQASHMASQWTPEMDAALVLHINSLSRKLAIATALLHPHEIQISEAVLSSEKLNCLQGVPLESIRLRFALLQSLNNTLETFYLPLVDLRPAQIYNRSTAALLSMLRGLVFYDTKINLMNRVLNATEQRKPDQAAPEITLDPLETILKVEKSCLATWLCQAYRQLLSIPSRQFCVRLASGGDPTYAFNVRLTGEEVHGTSGSFRQFLWQAAKEISGPLLRLLIPCNNSDKKGRYIFRPGPMSFSEERLLQFFGQLLGITMRADIPLGLDMLACVWKLLVGAELDPVTDLKEADLLTYNYIKKIEMVETESELQALCSGVFSRFVYSSLAGEEVELINKGGTVQVCWENRQEYVDAIRGLRFQELLCEDRVRVVHCGIASIIPFQLMALMSPLDLEIRTSGLPVVDLDFLKAHTMYQVGLMETDQHIQFFWNTLSGLSQEDLGKFIKFACNQERIPQTCPCRDGNADSMHVPPYPMKIAPPDGVGQPDERYIRVETCMFMIKLPQYSSQEVMTQQLMYAINCREDPLSG